MDGYRPSTYGDAFADVYDEWYEDLSDPAATATFLTDRSSGLIVEFGSGTGRLARPLAALGRSVIGLDASTAMLAVAARTEPAVPGVAGDMSEVPLADGIASIVFIAFNTLFNVSDRAGQRRVLAEAARLLDPHDPAAAVVIEAFVPSTDAEGDGATGRSTDGPTGGPIDRIEVGRMRADAVVLRISRTDLAAGTVSGHHVELRDGEPVRLRPWHLAFAGPEAIDDMARSAGLVLAERCADWHATPFDDASTGHVSLYRRDATRSVVSDP